MEGIILIISIVVILWILKKLFTSSDKVWKVAKKNGLKKTKSNEKNCSKCKYGNKTITTSEGQQGSIYGINCSLKNIEVREDMVCKKFELLPKFEGKNSLFGS